MKQTIDLLYVEDNPDYVNFVGRAVKMINKELVYHYVTDGLDAINLFSNNKLKVAPAKLILLDMNLPGVNGIEILQQIRSRPALKFTPVIMFSTSESINDIQQSYASGANAYVIKPSGIATLTDTLKKICDFWLSVNCAYN